MAHTKYQYYFPLRCACRQTDFKYKDFRTFYRPEGRGFKSRPRKTERRFNMVQVALLPSARQ